MHKNGVVTGILCVMLLSVCFMILCGEKVIAAPPAVPTKTLKIGMVTTLSGPAAPWGLGFLEGGKYGINEINEKGGILVNGVRYKIELVSADDEYKSDVAASAARKLVYEEGIKFMTGTVGSGPVLGVQTVTEPAKVLFVADSTTPKFIGPKNTFSFRLHSAYTERLQAMYQWVIKQRPQMKTVFLYAPDTEVGYGCEPKTKEIIEKSPLKLLGTTFYPMATKDHYPYISKILASKPDMIELDGSSPAKLPQL